MTYSCRAAGKPLSCFFLVFSEPVTQRTWITTPQPSAQESPKLHMYATPIYAVVLILRYRRVRDYGSSYFVHLLITEDLRLNFEKEGALDLFQV
jgi:hypothetical protein